MKKNSIIGLIIGLVIGLSVATYAQTIYNYTISGTIQIPATVDVTITGFQTDYLGSLYLDPIMMKDNVGKARFQIYNTGSADLEIYYEANTPTTQLTIKLEGYEAHSTQGDVFNQTQTVTLVRGSSLDCNLVVTDGGAEVGDHTYELNIIIEAIE